MRTYWMILTDEERQMAAELGEARQKDAIRRGYKDKFGFAGDPLSVHINGASGECACAKVVGAPWHRFVGLFKGAANVGEKLQVRTRSSHTYELLIRPDDDPSLPYVLVIGNFALFEVMGWLIGGDARRPEWQHAHGDRDPAWFAPQAALHDMADLPRELSGAVAEPISVDEPLSALRALWHPER